MKVLTIGNAFDEKANFITYEKRVLLCSKKPYITYNWQSLNEVLGSNVIAVFKIKWK